MSEPATLAWFARHEARLAWRDWRDMFTGGGRRSLTSAMIVLTIVVALIHLPVWALVVGLDMAAAGVDRSTLMITSLALALFASLLTAQATEMVTRSLYTRGDLDLIVSSPVALTRLFTVRLIANALPIAVLAMALVAPLVNIMAILGGPRWLAGFGVALAFGLAASALAVTITIGLFRIFGARRTRMIAQIVAAVIGAAFAIGIQVMAIMSYGAPTGAVLFLTVDAIAGLPDVTSPLWLPARAMLGDGLALIAILAASAALMLVVTAVVAPNFATISLSATDLAQPRRKRRPSRLVRVPANPRTALRRKELLLLRRDPWLVSQTLTQLLYLLPPALLLSQSFHSSERTPVIVAMVLVTVGGQLAGALAWLAISGEDAPDLVATAPVAAGAVTRAKVEAVMTAVAMALFPLLAVFAALAPLHAAMTLVGLVLASLSTIRIQLWFRIQAKRSHFRRRHTSSRIATFGEALVSFSWAAATGLATTFNWFAIVSVVIALMILAGVRAVAPRGAQQP